MKVAITTKKDLKNPHLEIDINLEKGTTNFALTYTCDKCAGYGCHNQACDDRINLSPEDVVDTLGPESRSVLQKVFESLLSSPVAPQSDKKKWLVNPPIGMMDWANTLRDFANSISGGGLVINHFIGSHTAVIEATQNVADVLKQRGFLVSPNGTKSIQPL